MIVERTFLLLAACMSSAAYVQATCMTSVITSSGVSHRKAEKYERHLAKKRLTWQDITSAKDYWLSTVIRGPIHHARAIQRCLHTKSPCTRRRQCQNDGECAAHSQELTFYCKCKRSHEGQFCQHARSQESILKAIQANVRSNEKVLSAKERQLRNHDWYIQVLQSRILFVKTNMDAIVKSHVVQALRCTQQGLGYHFESKFAAKEVSADTAGPVASLVFRARGSGNNLRLSYSGKIHPSGLKITTRLFFTIDGEECRGPAKIELSVRQVATGPSDAPVILQGVCESISNGTSSGFKRGTHTIAVHAAMSSDHDVTPSGLVTTSLLEAREMCPGPPYDGYPQSPV